MTRIEAAAVKALAAAMRVSGVEVTIKRATATAVVQAIPGTTSAESSTHNDARLRSFVADWLIDVADYDFGSGPVEPAIGDEIVHNGTTYEVMNPGGSEPHCRYHDRATRTRWRIHTVET